MTTTTQTELDNIALIRRGYEAFGKGDMQTLATMIAPEARWHVPPTGIFTGEYAGRDAMFGYFAQLHRESEGTLRAVPLAMAASGDRVFVQEAVTAQRKGRTLEQSEVCVFTVSGGQVRDVREYMENHSEAARFWG
ncbi:MAG TPA: nuclear transport factor 2 family protein [Candidatus Limnocylindria bacterium]|jgi:ketosteroid isomerase-like protein|nr:nuclear transport factor 2 family protein [Candidatus Limnocylindria bacterium]